MNASIRLFATRVAVISTRSSSLFYQPSHHSFSRAFTTPLLSVKPVIRVHTSSYATSSASSTLGDAKDVQHLVERDQFMKVKIKLEADNRRRIPFSDYIKICTQEGLTESQAKGLAKSLSDSGVVLHFPNSDNAVLRDTLFLKPEEFTTVVSRLLGQITSDTFLKEQLEVKKTELVRLQNEIAPLVATRQSLQKKAHSRATTIVWAGLGYCVVQAVAVARLTWWELSWDVMEPVTYMLTFATALIGYSWFVATGTEYTYEGLMKSLEHRRLDKLIKKTNFPETQFQKLSKALAMKEDDVARTAEQLEYHNIENPYTSKNTPPSSPSSSLPSSGKEQPTVAEEKVIRL